MGTLRRKKLNIVVTALTSDERERKGNGLIQWDREEFFRKGMRRKPRPHQPRESRQVPG